MCYQYSLVKPKKEIESFFDVEIPWDVYPQYFINGFDFKPQLCITDHGAMLLNWGLIPHWVKHIDQANQIRVKTLNARSESAFEKDSFRDAISSHRCIVPMSGFFDSHHFGTTKVPYYVFPRDKSLWGLAGIWTSWKDPYSNEIIESFSILTMPANPLMAKIHNSKQRMPVILEKAAFDAWVDPTLKRDEIENMFMEYEDGSMDYYPLNSLVNRSIPSSLRNVPEVLEKRNYDPLSQGSLFN